jgi:putative redox protein
MEEAMGKSADIGSDAGATLTPGDVLVVETGDGRYDQLVRAGRHTLHADEPVDLGGDDRGLSPYDYLLAGLGACTSMTIRMYALRKGLPLQRVSVRLRHDRIHARDCEDCETKEGRLDEITREITIEGDLDEAQRRRLLEMAEMCPVHRTLTGEVKVRTRLADSPQARSAPPQ